MGYVKKLQAIFHLIEKKEVPFPKTLQKKHVSYLSNANAVALIRSLLKGKNSEDAISLLAQERPVQRLLNHYSTAECAFIISTNG